MGSEMCIRDRVPSQFIRVHNMFYSISQATATIVVMNNRNIDMIFTLLIPIQTAPFCMTLVKKGIIDQGTWHLYYTFALLIGYWHNAIANYPLIPIQRFSLPALGLFAVGRFAINVNKYILWGAVAGAELMYLVCH